MFKKKCSKKKDIGPLSLLKKATPEPRLVTKKRIDQNVSWAEFNPCNSCPDADKHCYECSHEHRRLDGNGWTIPPVESEEWATY